MKNHLTPGHTPETFTQTGLEAIACYLATLLEFDLEPFAENLEKFPTGEELRARLDAETLRGLAGFAAHITGSLKEDKRPKARSLFHVFSAIQRRANSAFPQATDKIPGCAVEASVIVTDHRANGTNESEAKS